MRRLNYSNEDIWVCFVRGKEPPKFILEASGNNCEADRRTSKRSRKTAFGDSKVLKVSGSTTIYQLKMMIWESFGVGCVSSNFPSSALVEIYFYFYVQAFMVNILKAFSQSFCHHLILVKKNKIECPC